MSLVDNTEKVLKTVLQKNIRFTVNGKGIREGKLILYQIKDYYMSLTIFTKKSQTKQYEIPIPFDIQHSGEDIIFDYTLHNVTKNDSLRKWLITSLSNKIGKKSKLYNNKLTIEPDD
jgi:hypothetical protein|tara:strand:+ start:8001 stop:8351 length:351 start_codon:yes stop_codon:yes gene_type:complete